MEPTDSENFGIVSVTKFKNKFLHDYCKINDTSIPKLAKKIGVSYAFLLEIARLNFTSDVERPSVKNNIELVEKFFKRPFDMIFPKELYEANRQMRAAGQNVKYTMVKEHSMPRNQIAAFQQQQQIEHHTPELEAITEESRKELIANLDSIDKRRADMIKLYYGIDGKEHSVSEIARMYDLTVTTITNLIARGIRTLRKKMWSVKKTSEEISRQNIIDMAWELKRAVELSIPSHERKDLDGKWSVLLRDDSPNSYRLEYDKVFHKKVIAPRQTWGYKLGVKLREAYKNHRLRKIQSRFCDKQYVTAKITASGLDILSVKTLKPTKGIS